MNTLLEFGILLLIAGIAGAIGQTLAGSSRGGCLTAIAVGFIGAILGTWIARGLELPEWFSIRVGTWSFPVIWSVIGSALFVAVLSLMTRGRRRPLTEA